MYLQYIISCQSEGAYISCWTLQEIGNDQSIFQISNISSSLPYCSSKCLIFEESSSFETTVEITLSVHNFDLGPKIGPKFQCIFSNLITYL